MLYLFKYSTLISLRIFLQISRFTNMIFSFFQSLVSRFKDGVHWSCSSRFISVSFVFLLLLFLLSYLFVLTFIFLSLLVTLFLDEETFLVILTVWRSFCMFNEYSPSFTYSDVSEVCSLPIIPLWYLLRCTKLLKLLCLVKELFIFEGFRWFILYLLNLSGYW